MTAGNMPTEYLFFLIHDLFTRNKLIFNRRWDMLIFENGEKRCVNRRWNLDLGTLKFTNLDLKSLQRIKVENIRGQVKS